LSFLFLSFFFITALSSFTKEEIVGNYCEEETSISIALCTVNLTLGDPCSVCITCPDAGQRVLIEDPVSGASYIVLPKSGVALCIDVAIGRCIDVTQFGNSQTGDFLGDFACN